MQASMQASQRFGASFGSFSVLSSEEIREVSPQEVPMAKGKSNKGKNMVCWKNYDPSVHSWEQVDLQSEHVVCKKQQNTRDIILRKILSRKIELSNYELELAYDDFILQGERMKREIEIWEKQNGKLQECILEDKYKLMNKAMMKKQKKEQVKFKPRKHETQKGSVLIIKQKKVKKEKENVEVSIVQVSDTEQVRIEKVGGKIVNKVAMQVKKSYKSKLVSVQELLGETSEDIESENEEYYIPPVKNSNSVFIDYLLQKEKKNHNKIVIVKNDNKKQEREKQEREKKEREEKTILDSFFTQKTTAGPRYNLACKWWLQGKKCKNINCNFVHKKEDFKNVQCKKQDCTGRCRFARPVKQNVYENYGEALIDVRKICAYWHRNETVDCYLDRMGMKKQSEQKSESRSINNEPRSRQVPEKQQIKPVVAPWANHSSLVGEKLKNKVNELNNKIKDRQNKTRPTRFDSLENKPENKAEKEIVLKIYKKDAQNTLQTLISSGITKFKLEFLD